MQVTNEMVNRFLMWKLPNDFYPDCGISFDGRKDDEWNKNKTWPTGTNLLTGDQARHMLEYVLAEALGPDQQGNKASQEPPVAGVRAAADPFGMSRIQRPQFKPPQCAECGLYPGQTCSRMVCKRSAAPQQEQTP